MFKFIIKVAVVLLIGFGAYLYFNGDVRVPKSPDIEEVSYEDIREAVSQPSQTDTEDSEPQEDLPQEQDQEEESQSDTQEEGSLPKQFKLAVPFTPQAPHANWALPYQEACEEASVYMVQQYYEGAPSGLIDPDVADAAILEIVDFEEDFFGYYLDTTAQETARFADMFYGMGAVVVDNPTVEQIKAEIVAGRPVIVPAAGRELPNPFFSGEGPLYHMIVIKGYTETSFITNDPGTKNGNDFVYAYADLFDAMGDWNNGDPANGAKRVIFTSP